MTNPPEQKAAPSLEGRRAAFEKWATEHNFDLRREQFMSEIYWNPGIQQRWEVWQACDESHRDLRSCLQQAFNFLKESHTGVRPEDSERCQWVARASKILEKKS